jgi:hypothetical protein
MRLHTKKRQQSQVGYHLIHVVVIGQLHLGQRSRVGAGYRLVTLKFAPSLKRAPMPISGQIALADNLAK